MTPILPEDRPKENLEFPILINGYGLILDRNDFRNFCRHYAALRSAYDQLVRIRLQRAAVRERNIRWP